ncbi:MAG TPA: glycosyltransferase family 4 protein, partial [Actinomycetota bacterium]|nr:glycosyltransferase family 4 protein [Actinomycetota bacterium]
VPNAVRTIRTLSRTIAASKAAMVVSNMDKAHIYGGTAAWLAGVPAVWWQQGIPNGGKFGALAARVPAAAVVCSSDDAMTAQRRLTPRHCLAKIHLGIDIGEVVRRRGSGVPIRERLGWSGQRVVGIVGRLQPWKGQTIFLQAAARIALERPETRFLVVGGAILGWEGDYPAELHRLADDLGLGDRVRFVGHQDDVYPWFDAMDVVVHASFGEPFGLVAVEAMALGKPTVATASGGPLEIIEDEVSGLLVPVRDPDAMAAAVCRILSNPSFAEKLSAGAQARAPLFSDGRMAANFVELFRSFGISGDAGAPISRSSEPGP